MPLFDPAIFDPAIFDTVVTGNKTGGAVDTAVTLKRSSRKDPFKQNEPFLQSYILTADVHSILDDSTEVLKEIFEKHWKKYVG